MVGRWARVVRVLAAVAFPAALLAACAVPTTSTPAVSPTLNLLAAFPTTLDPVLDSGDAGIFFDSVFSGLVRYDAGGDLKPDLAQAWTISQDRTIYTFTLRKNATFHNGDRVTAQSIIYAINRACDPHNGSPVAGDYLGDIQGVRERLAGQAAAVSGVAAEGPSIVRFTLTHPDDAFLAKLTFPITYALDQKTVAAGGKDWWQHPNGSGPYRLTEWQPQAEATLTRFAGYYGAAPALGKVVLHNPAAITNLSQAFSTGTLDLLPLPATAQDMASFVDPQSKIAPQVRQAFHVFDLPTLQYLAINRKAPPFDDVNVRRALNLALDKALLVTVALGGDGWPAGNILPPEQAGYQRNSAAYPFNLVAAKAAYAASRYATAVPTVTLATGERLPNGQPGPVTSTLAAMIEQNLGWHVTLSYMSEATMDADLAQGQPPADLVMTGWQADYGDPSDFLDLLFRSGRATNLTQYSNPQVDQLLNQADQATSTQQRVLLYRQAQAAIMRDAPIVPLFFAREFVLLNPRVSSLPILPDGSFDLRDATIG